MGGKLIGGSGSRECLFCKTFLRSIVDRCVADLETRSLSHIELCCKKLGLKGVYSTAPTADLISVSIMGRRSSNRRAIDVSRLKPVSVEARHCSVFSNGVG